MSKILYIGNFLLPDKNAAAHRVIGIANAMAKYNDVMFINFVPGYCAVPQYKNYFGFKCYECNRESNFKFKKIYRIIKGVIEENKIQCIIMYNYNSIVMQNMQRYCRKKGIIFISDITEWYEPTGSIFIKLFKAADISLRMKVLNKRADGVIVISRFLEKYYNKYVKTIRIPPLVDGNDKKWEKEPFSETENSTFLYAGSPSKSKERLDLIMKAFSILKESHPNVKLEIIGVTEEQFVKMYSLNDKKKKYSDGVTFFGFLPHAEALSREKKATWTIIVRDQTRLVNAGFPTKYVESIACGTPVVTNEFSDVGEYMLKYNTGILVKSSCDLLAGLQKAVSLSDKQYELIKTNCNLCNAFDYRTYESDLNVFLAQINRKNKTKNKKRCK